MTRATRLLSLLTLALLLCSSAFAQTDVSTNGTSGNWSSTGTWSPAVVPNNAGPNTYNVQILNTPSPVTVTLDTNITINGLGLQSGTTLATLSSSTLTLASLDNSGDMEFVNSNTLTINGPATIQATGTLSLAGGSTANFNSDVINSGALFTGLGGTGGNTVNVSGSVTNSGSLVMFGTNDTLNVSGTLTNTGIVSIFGAGDVVNVGSLSNTTGALTLTVSSGGTFNITGGGPGITDIASPSSLDIGGAFNVINGQTSTSALANLTSVEGSLTLENGQTTVITPGGAPATLTFAMGSSVDVDNGSTLTVAGKLVSNGMLTLGANGGPSDVLNVSGAFNNNGMFALSDGSGDVANVSSLNNTGAIYIGTGTTMTITGGLGITDIAADSSLNIAGDLLMSGGGSGIANLTTVEGFLTLENGETTSITPLGGTLSVGNGGSWNVGGAGTVANINGSILSSGSVVLMGSGNVLNLTGNLTSGDEVMVEHGNSLSVGGAFQQTNGSTSIAGALTAGSFAQTGGVTTVQAGGTLTAPNVQVSGGVFQGTGSVVGNFSLTGGTLLPGSPDTPGTLSLSGSYVQGPGGTLVIDISGTPAGQFSVFSISGLATLDGAVDFTFLDGFTPTVGDEFTFLTFGSVSGDFSSINFTNWTCPVGDVCTDVFGAGTLTLEIQSAPVTPTPEPASLVLLGSGLLACCASWRKRRIEQHRQSCLCIPSERSAPKTPRSNEGRA